VGLQVGGAAGAGAGGVVAVVFVEGVVGAFGGVTAASTGAASILTEPVLAFAGSGPSLIAFVVTACVVAGPETGSAGIPSAFTVSASTAPVFVVLAGTVMV